MENYIFNSKLYRKNLGKKSFKIFPLLMTIMILFVVLFVFFKPQNKQTNKFYFLEIGNFSTYSQAQKLAKELQDKDSGGHIFFQEKYHVFASFYPTKKQAENVLENILPSYPKATIFCLENQKFISNNSFTTTQNESVKSFCDNVDDSINNLSSHLTEFEKNLMSSSILEVRINQIFDSIQECKNSIYTQFDKPKYMNIKKSANEIEKSIDNIKSSYQQQNFKQAIRLEIMNIIFSYHHFLSLV